MKMKTSEVLDRWTILRMQARFDSTAKKELALYDDEVNGLYKQDVANRAMGDRPITSSLTFVSALLDLTEANAKIWENESAIRNAYKNDPANFIVRGASAADASNTKEASEWLLREIGRRTLLIRDYNKTRVGAKQLIDKLFNEIPSIKVDHASNPDNDNQERGDNDHPPFWNVVLTSIPDYTKKIAVIKTLRELLGCGLKEAKEMTDSVPQTIKYSVPDADAWEMKRKLEREGGRVELR